MPAAASSVPPPPQQQARSGPPLAELELSSSTRSLDEAIEQLITPPRSPYVYVEAPSEPSSPNAAMLPPAATDAAGSPGGTAGGRTASPPPLRMATVAAGGEERFLFRVVAGGSTSPNHSVVRLHSVVALRPLQLAIQRTLGPMIGAAGLPTLSCADETSGRAQMPLASDAALSEVVAAAAKGGSDRLHLVATFPTPPSQADGRARLLWGAAAAAGAAALVVLAKSRR